MPTPTENTAGAASESGFPGRLLGHYRESRVFWRMRGRMTRSLAAVGLKTMRLQVASVTVASVVMWFGLYLLFYIGFRFVHIGLAHEAMRAQFIHAIFNVFFLALTAMLVFSSAIILYGSLFKTDEVQFLMTTPTRPERVVLHKFQETVFFSCWGFVLLASPMLVAYGRISDAPWYYYAMLAPFVIAFVLVPAAVGAIICLLVVRVLPTVRVHLLGIFVAIAVAACVFFGWRVLAYQNRDLMTPSWFEDVLTRLQFSEQRLLPSWWLSSGLLEAANPTSLVDGRPAWQESLLFLAVLTSNALVLQVVLAWLARRGFRVSYSELPSLSRKRKRHHGSWTDWCVMWICAPFPRSIRMFLVKDIKLFRRDPVQWSQFAIFFSLLLFYFLNVRRFDYGRAIEQWMTVISFLNVAVVGLILSTFTTRFIFPMISLEGRRFWILATAPIERDMILWSKFWFACVGSLLPSAALVLISDVMLGIAQRLPWIAVVHQLSIVMLCVGLSALAVGMGARLPNLREPSPSKIAAGFGGTLNLVFSALYILAVVLLTAVPCFFWADKVTLGQWSRYPRETMFGGPIGLGTGASVAIGAGLAVLLGIMTTVVPLRIGISSFRRLEV